MYLNVRHTTTYSYARPAWDSFNEVWLRPADDYRQTLLAFELQISPKATVRERRDQFGNLIYHFHLPGDHTELMIEATSAVVTYPVPVPLEVSADVLPDLRHRFFEYLAPTLRVPLNEKLAPCVWGAAAHLRRWARRLLNGDEHLSARALSLFALSHRRQHAADRVRAAQFRGVSRLRARDAGAVPRFGYPGPLRVGLYPLEPARGRNLDRRRSVARLGRGVFAGERLGRV